MRIEMSCTDFDIHLALNEAQTIMEALKCDSCQVKVFHSDDRDPEKGHSWVTVNARCDIHDKVEIYRLQKEIQELKRIT